MSFDLAPHTSASGSRDGRRAARASLIPACGARPQGPVRRSRRGDAGAPRRARRRKDPCARKLARRRLRIAHGARGARARRPPRSARARWRRHEPPPADRGPSPPARLLFGRGPDPGKVRGLPAQGSRIRRRVAARCADRRAPPGEPRPGSRRKPAARAAEGLVRRAGPRPHARPSPRRAEPSDAGAVGRRGPGQSGERRPLAAGADAQLRPLSVQPHRPLGTVGARRRIQRGDHRPSLAIGVGMSLARQASEETVMNAIDVQRTTSSVYGAVQLGYVLVESPRLAEWKRFAAEGIGMALAEESASDLAFRTDAHARRLIVRKNAGEDVSLGWQVDGAVALDAILARLAARKVAVEQIGGEEAALRGVERLWRFVGPKRQALELFVEPKIAASPVKVLGEGFVTGERGLGHVAITTRKPEAMIAFWREIFDAKVSDFIEDRISGVDLKFTFLRVNSRHHSIAVAATKGLAMDPFTTKIQHLE